MRKASNSSVSQKKSTWVIDKKFEETSMEFLRAKTEILKELGTKEIVKDRDRQIKGIDLICDIPKAFPKSFFKLKGKNVDVKSIAKVIPTFSFEISGNKSSGQIGWLANSTLETDYYLIVYHQIENESQSYKTNKQKMTTDNVIYTKALLIKKDKLKSLIKDSINNKSFNVLVEEIRELSEEKKGINRYVLDTEGKVIEKGSESKSEIYFTVSNQIKERPINIIVKRHILEQISERIWEVDGNGKPYLS